MNIRSHAIDNINLDTKYDTNIDAKVEENMGTIIGIKLGMNFCEINVDATTDVEMDLDLDATGSQPWMKIKMQKRDVNMDTNLGAIVEKKLHAKVDATDVDAKVNEKWGAKSNVKDDAT